jgi:hypothetical protein
MNKLLLIFILLSADPATKPFAIEVVDEQTGRGVPLVELTTTSGITYVTDSAGLVAFDEPGLVGQRVHFAVKSHGYEARKDGFGFPGVALDTTPGGAATIKIRRTNIAERLYRVTGQGIYRDSVLLGCEPPMKQPLINSKVTGSDSVMNAMYRGKLYWFWGDTNWPAYPLGLFHTPGATSELPKKGGLDPARGVDLTYFTGDNGFARATAKMPGEGPTWISGVAVLPDSSGLERMLCGYSKIRPPLDAYARGIAEWNDETNEFRQVSEFAVDVPLYPDGHPLIVRENGEDYVYFAAPYPLVRTRATAKSYKDLATYEAYTCLAPGSTLAEPTIDRDESGRVRYGWKRGTPPVDAQQQAKLVKRGLMTAEEGLLQLRDAANGSGGGKEVTAHAGSVAWNEYRKKYVLITVQIMGTSMVGEIWYAEAGTLLGPWKNAIKIVTHDKYSFYNPKQHPYFDADGGRYIFFEGTYTHTFSGNEQKTPRYDYNQIMYRLDLADERLRPAQQR